jgi:aryl-alcohol dehydrogenase-like predicted oxidoreductase
MENIQKIQLGQNGPFVSKLGLGCMRMSSIWGGPTRDENESIATIQQALDCGINFLNTGDFYGAGHNEMLVGKAIKGRRNNGLPISLPLCDLNWRCFFDLSLLSFKGGYI